MHVTNVSNVEATLNAHFRTALNAISAPSYFTGAITFTQNWSEIAAILPCYSVHHLPIASVDMWQGRGGGIDGQNAVRSHGLMEISAWVSRDQKMSGQDVWQARLRWMQAAVTEVYAKAPRIVIKDYTTPASPAATLFTIRTGNLSIIQTAPDTNPAIERRKLQIGYQWELITSLA